MPVTIRSATLDDVPAILAIEQQAAERSPLDLRAIQQAALMTEWFWWPKKPASSADFVCAKAVADEWEIENVVVAAEFLRRGIADELMRELIRAARKTQAASSDSAGSPRIESAGPPPLRKTRISRSRAAAGLLQQSRWKMRSCTRCRFEMTDQGCIWKRLSAYCTIWLVQFLHSEPSATNGGNLL